MMLFVCLFVCLFFFFFNIEKTNINYYFFVFFVCLFFDANLVWMERSCRYLSITFFFCIFWS